jgi:subtilisin-like proprotein convertase family protein
LASRDIPVDVVAPEPVALSVSYEAAGETQPITQTGTTIREPEAVLQMVWTESSDGSGLAGHQAGWTSVDSSGASTTTWTTVGPAETRLATTTAGEAHKLIASLGSTDTYGNTTWQSFGPVYADGPLTPDYTPLDGPDNTYHGWLESGCSLLGTDRRLGRVASEAAMLHGEQALYATWDGGALRLAWSGADPSADGDLFVYLDTAPGGSTTLFNPFTATNPLSGTLPGSTPTISLVSSPAGRAGTQAEAMAADYGVWVQDADTAWLLAWDGTAWISSTLLSEAQLQYRPTAAGGLTDLSLPFALLGIADPAATPLGLVAFASEEGALRLWAALPGPNPVTSLLAAGSLGHSLAATSVPLSHAYRWPSLGAGLCPNGSLALAAGQTPYPDAEVRARLAVEPAGTVYHYLGDHLVPWAGYLLDDKPADFSRLLSFLDGEHPYVQDGQVLTYTLHVQNSGRDTARGVVAQVWSGGALTLPGGAPLEGDARRRHYQEVAVGDLAPGEVRQVSLPGRIDVAWARPLYDECLATYPDRPRLCELSLRWALLRVEIADETGSGPLERMWADHRVDFQAPRFAGILLPEQHIGAGRVHLSGYAYDETGVPNLSLEVRRPDGAAVSVACANPAPGSGTWACDWDAAAANGGVPPQDGQVFQVRLRVTDGAGLSGEAGPWLPFVVDTVPPTVTAELPVAALTGLPASLRTLRLGGRLADNHGAAGVEVCLQGTCRSARTALDGPPRLRSYADQPDVAVPLAACDAGGVQRSFVVDEAFAVRSLSLGLRAEHGERGQIRAELVSPAGTRVRVLSGETALGGDGQNLMVLLTDAAGGRVLQQGGDHDLSLPGFLYVARPDEPLSAFVGEEAAGTWTLSICDAEAGGEEGSYLGGRLVLQPQNTAAPAGTWSGRLALPELDGVAQTLTVYGLDEAGNRSTQPFSTTFRVDNVAPVLAVTEAISQAQLTPDLAPLDVLAGTVADGGQVRRLFAAIITPEGQLHLQPVTRAGDGWSFALRAGSAGVYRIRIVAEDLAGNRTTAGPVEVAVAGIPLPHGLVYLPLIFKGSGESERAPEPTATITPTLTITPTWTVTPTLTPAPTGTMTPALTLTPPLTLTPTAVVSPTGTAEP